MQRSIKAQKKELQKIAPDAWKKKLERVQLYQLQKAFAFDPIKKIEIQELIRYRDEDAKGTRKTLYVKQVTERNDLILNVVPQTRLQLNDRYQDQFPLLEIRKQIMRLIININIAAYKIYSSKPFEKICIGVILVNSFSLATEDPLAVSTTPLQNAMENVFLGLYSTEMAIKILALGFVFNKGAYLRDPWNILDFIIVCSAYLTLFQELSETIANGGNKKVVTAANANQGGLSLNSLRAFRVLRPLRAITSIKGLQVLVLSVLTSLPLLQDTMLVLMGFFLVFAIAGTQLLSGVLKQTCVSIEDGSTWQAGYQCGARQTCPEGYFCGKQNENPNYGVTNFDNILFSLLVVFQCITLEGWSAVMIQFQQSYSNIISIILFALIVLIGAFFLINLLLAVINSSFSTTHRIEQEKLAILKEKLRLNKAKKIDEDNFDENEHKDKIGISNYWIGRRAAKQIKKLAMIAVAKKHEREKLQGGLFSTLPVITEEPLIEVPSAPLIPQKINKEEESEYDFSYELNKLILGSQKNDSDDEAEEPKPKVVKKDKTKEIKRYAINEMQTATKLLPKTKGRRDSFQTASAEKLAVKLPEISGVNYKGNFNDFKKLDDLLNLTGILGEADNSKLEQSSFLHPYDLTDNHSNKIQLEDVSQSEQEASVVKIRNKYKPKNVDSSDELSSCIASDSSFEEKVRVVDEDQIAQFIAVNQTMETDIRGKDVSQSKIATTSQKQETPAPPTQKNVLDDDEPKRKSKKKKKGKKAKKQKVSGPEAKFQNFKSVIRSIDTEFLNETKSKNPLNYINKNTHKIAILAGVPYQSTSADSVFEIRNNLNEQLQLQDGNIFVKAILPDQHYDFQTEQLIQPTFQASQLKVVYKVIDEEPIEFDDGDDDAIILALQPYDTVMSVGYGHLLTHRPVKFVSRRSDIIVSSTLQLTLTPNDSGYRPQDHALMTLEQIQDWCIKRNQYRAMFIENAKLFADSENIDQTNEDSVFKHKSTIKGDSTLKHKQSDFFKRLSPLKMKTITQDQSSVILSEKVKEVPKVKMIPKTLLTKPLPPEKLNLMAEEEKRLYSIQKGKYDSYMRVIQKKAENGEHPKNRKFDLSEVKNLMNGAHHEDDDDEDVFNDQTDAHMMYMSRDETFRNAKLDQFENYARKVLKRNNHKVKRGNQVYIPIELKKELDLPDDIGKDEVNFSEVIKSDCSRKRRTPLWSGQDVLDIGLTTELSYWVISKINAVRVWPKGPINMFKKLRVLLKMLVKMSMFNNALTFCVLLNTVIMGMQKYNMSLQLQSQLEFYGNIFTWIFISEMTVKLIAIGPTKYLRDKMNWLDGGVVSLSIMELLMNAISGGGGNLSAFRTVRVLRTFRVLRVARLLRALKSMKVILTVIQKSASSFVYITLLMFVFTFIYTLLGMQVFGGQFNFPDGKPRGNYDTFIVAFLTVFQVLTTENWNVVLYDSMRSPSIGQFIPVIYYVSWIFIGNYILLNLFLAILLDGFLIEDDEEIGDIEELERIAEEKRITKITKEKIRRLKKMGVDQSHISQIDPDSRKKKDTEELIDDVDDMDEKTIKEIFLDEGLMNKKDPEREKRLLFDGVYCEKAFYLLSQQNRFRIFIYKLQKNKIFDNIIMFLIALSSLKLAADTYFVVYPDDSILIQLSGAFDKFLNVCFLFECVSKNIALGTLMDQGSYFIESWNQLDAFIVFTSMLDMCLASINLPIIKILRLLRTLRPLRVISHNVAMKLIVASLFESVGAIFNVIIVVVAVWLMFGIFAINIFAGKFFYCSIGQYTYLTKYECNSHGGSWLRANQNFDDIFQAMLTLFNVAAIEAWPDVMVQSMDCTDVDKGPVIENSSYYGFFFVIFILIGSFFLLNFFIGVLFMKYSQAAKNETKGYTEENLVWIDIQKMIVEQKCEFDLMNKPDFVKHPNRYKYWRIVTSKPFDLFITGVIVLNIVQMGINFEDAPQIYVKLLDISNYFFTAIFVAEAYLKLRAYSWRYFEQTQNKFDCFIVISSLVDIGMSLLAADASQAFSIGPQIARMMRVMRVTRVVRLASKNEGLQALMQTITLSVGSLTNVLLLLMLVLFIFSILGVFFFGDLTTGFVIDDYHNFQDFGKSYLLLFMLSTGENWNYFTYDCNKTLPNCVPGESCGTSYSPVYFICFVMIVQNVMLNLFILVIIQQFETYYMAEDNPITKFKKNLDVFMVTWVDFTATRSRCVKLREKRLNDFFKKLPMPIGLPLDTTEDQMKKVMLKMGIKCDDGYIYFNELLYRCMRRQYGSFKLNRRMQIQELKTQYKIFKIKLAAQGNYLVKEPQQQFFSRNVGSGKSVNPFLQDMYYNISFNTWLNYARKMQKRVRFQQKQEIKKQKCWAEGVEFVPGVLMEEEAVIKYVYIENQEILEFTSEGEQSSSEEEIVYQKQTRSLTLQELKLKKKCKPDGGSQSRELFQSISIKKVTHHPVELNLLGIGKNMNANSKSVKINRNQTKLSVVAQPIPEVIEHDSLVSQVDDAVKVSGFDQSIDNDELDDQQPNSSRQLISK